MAKINVLSFEIANLIAAGEVVDRPASVLKELLENSVDAGAHKIRADIKSGGITLIKVSDDGHGIEAADLPIAIKRHATSKISDKSDLDAIMTLGFRGEALAATAAVSKLTIISKTRAADAGTMLVSEGGAVTEVSEVGCADGTTVLVQDLFFNVPARRNFLKKDKTESMACQNVMAKVAMSHPEISFEFRVDGIVKFTTIGDGKLINSLYAIEGADFAKKLLDVDVKDGPVKVRGYIGRSDNVRSNRNYINTFINKRYVKSNTVTAALEQAFSSYIAPGKFPVSALFIDVDSRMVDVNVHPAKLEVKFSDESAVFSAVYGGVKNALENAAYRHEMMMPEPKRDIRVVPRTFLPIDDDKKSVAQRQIAMDTAQKKADTAPEKEATASYYSAEPSFHAVPATNTRGFDKGAKAVEPSTVTPKKSMEILEELRRVNGAPAAPKHIPEAYSTMRANASERIKNEMQGETVSAERVEYVSEQELRSKIFTDGNRRYRYVGELFFRYIVLESQDIALLIDKHAAHERINFEEMKNTVKSDRRIASQAMLFPIEVHIGCEGIAVAEEHADELRAIGYDFTIENDRLKMCAFPRGIDPAVSDHLLASIINSITEGKGDAQLGMEQWIEHSLYQIACKSSIKSGSDSGSSNISWLIEQIMKMPDITVCPHGRPVAVELSKNKLDREFERIQ